MMPLPLLNHLPRLPKDKSPPIGCIGSGFIMADCHLVAYRNAGFNPVAIASRNRKNSEAVAERHGIKKVHNTYKDLLSDKSISIIDIAVPPQTELEIVHEAVKHADHIKGILAQKPLGINYRQAKEIVTLCA